MPWKDKEYAKQKAKERYEQHKEYWKNPDGTWKKENQARRRVRRREYYAENAEFREKHNAKAKARRDAKRVFGECPICHEEAQLVQDHCHASGRLRSKICNSCNKMLGFAYDTQSILKAGAEYLRIYEEEWAKLA